MRLIKSRSATTASIRHRFAAQQNGNVSLLFGLSLVPLIGVAGLGVDYGIAIAARTKLDGAADAAALAAVVTAKNYVADNPGLSGVSDLAIALGKTKATSVFRANAGTVAYTTVQLNSPVLTRSGQTFNSEVSYSAAVNSTFGKLFGTTSNAISNRAKASTDLASYLDFYLMVDVSGSMGLPTTPDGMASLAAQNRDMFDDYRQGCQFACHFPKTGDQTYNGWNLAAGKIKLRSDSVNEAVCNLLDRASIQEISQQYRIGIYPFINQLGTLKGITSNISDLKTSAQCSSSWPMTFTNLLDTGSTQLNTSSSPRTGLGSGGTHFETSLPQLQAKITSFGSGATTTTGRPFVFIITDGMQNDQGFQTVSSGKTSYPGNPSKFWGYADAWWSPGGSQPKQMNPALCDALKTAGATVSVLYIPYITIQFKPNDGSISWENTRVNGFSPTLATPLKACASPGSYFSADTPEGIKQALSAMFDQAIQVTRLTQ